jgi:Flp pilus assembly protein TadD
MEPIFYKNLIALALVYVSLAADVDALAAPLKLPEPIANNYSSTLLERIPAGKPREVLMEAGKALQSNDLVRATRLFNELAVLAPRSAAPHIGLGELAIKDGDYKKASAHFNRAILVDQSDPNAYIGASKTSKALRNFPLAEKQIRSAIRLSPNEPLFHLQLGDLLLVGLKNPKQAALAYERSIALSPQQAAAAFALATAYQQLGRQDESLKQLITSASLEPKNPLPQWGIGRWYLAAAQPQKALLALNQALTLKPDYIPALQQKSEALFQLDKPELAIEAIRNAMLLNLKDGNLALQFALALQRAKRPLEAETEFRKLLIAAPQSSEVLARYAWLLSGDLNRASEALSFAQQAIKNAPQDVFANISLAQALRLTGQLSAAQVHALRALKNTPVPSSEIFLELALLSKDQANLVTAKDWAKKASALDPNNLRAKLLLEAMN